MIKNVISWVLLALGCSTLIRVLLILDLNKRVYNHAPGPCRLMEGIENGSEDIELISELGIAFISSGLVFLNDARRTQVTGRIFLFDFNKKDFNLEPLKIEGPKFVADKFAPHGLSSYVSKGRVTLYVINHPPGGHCVEVFTFNKDKHFLTHTRTIDDPLFVAPNDLVVVGPDKFFLTNFHYFQNKWLFKLESLLQLNLGSIVLYNGRKAAVIEAYSHFPNGIAVSPDKDYLYVASPLSEVIKVYKLGRDLSIEKHTEIALLSSPDNIFVDPDNGDIWLGCHPIFHETMKHMEDPNVPASSQVLKIRMQDGHTSWIITEPYANDGSQLSASTVAVYHKGQMLVGTIMHKLLHCTIHNSDIL